MTAEHFIHLNDNRLWAKIWTVEYILRPYPSRVAVAAIRSKVVSSLILIVPIVHWDLNLVLVL